MAPPPCAQGPAGVLTGREITIPNPQPTESAESTAATTSVTIECEDLCPAYIARVIRGVKIGPSPDWMQDRINHLFSLVGNCLAGINRDAHPEKIQLSANTLWASVHGITLLTIDDKLSLNVHTDPTVMLSDLLDNYLITWKNA